MNDLIERIDAELDGVELPDRRGEMLREAAAFIKQIETQRGAMMKCVIEVKAERDALRRVWNMTQASEIEAATMERCIDALKNLTGRTRGPIIEEAIGVIRALAKPAVEPKEDIFAVGDRVIVEGQDFTFEGNIIHFGPKRSGRISYAIEDDRGIVHTYSRRLIRTLAKPAETAASKP